MTFEKQTAAVVGACGGAGTTRLTVEMAATMARTGRDICIVDTALPTQGLAGYVSGRIDPDITRVLADDAPLEDALIELDLDFESATDADSDYEPPDPGRVVACPASAPLERLARAETAGSARSLEAILDGVAGFDTVLVDTPPVATNLALSAVTAVDRVGVVAPPDERGADALQRLRGRLADAGAPLDAVIANRIGNGDKVSESEPVDADVLVPESDVWEPSGAPASVDPDTKFSPAVAHAAESLFDQQFELTFPEERLLEGFLE